MPWRFLYRFLIFPIGWIVFLTAGLFDEKVRRGIRGRKKLFKELNHIRVNRKSSNKRIWFHSSSMGEFEQAKPIITELKKRYPDVEIIVTFFSPSGYEHCRSYKLANFITYIPFDFSGDARKFIECIQPAAAVMVRYDVWPNHLWELNRLGIPTFIANATLRENSPRKFLVIKQFHRQLYDMIDYILTVSQADKKVFESFGLTRPVLEVIGDTRYDQVWQRSVESKSRHLLPTQVIADKKVLVVGSIWQEDEKNLLPAISRLAKDRKQLLVVVVPHEPNLETLERLENELDGHVTSIRFSNLNDYQGEQLIVVDSVGILMSLYQYGLVAYVGGSFKQGVHNVLEPAVYGIPIIIGPKYENSREAIQLIEDGAAFVGRNEEELFMHLQSQFNNEQIRLEAGKRALQLVERNIGATQMFLSYLEKVL